MNLFGYVSRDLLVASREAHQREIEALEATLAYERGVSQQLLGELLKLRREGFNPRPPEPPVARREVEEPEGWSEVLAAIAERSGGRADLDRLMRHQARLWLNAKVELPVVLRRISQGWGGEE